MPLSKEDIQSLKAKLKQIKSSQGRFLYCPSGPAGDPVLLLDKKRINAADIRDLRKNARKKKFVRGFVEKRLEGGYTFHTRGEPPTKMQQDLKRFFVPAVPILRNSIIIPIERRSGVQAVDGQDADDISLSVGDGVEQHILETQMEVSEDAEHDARVAEEREEQLLKQLDALREQRLNSTFEADRAMDRFEDAASSFNPFKRWKKTQRRQEAFTAHEEVVRLDGAIEQAEAQLEAVRQDMAAARKIADAQRAVSDNLLTLWGEQQEDFWTAHRRDTAWLERAEAAGHAHRETSNEAETARNAWLAARAEVDQVHARIDAVIKVINTNDAEILHLQKEIAELQEKDQLSHSDVKLLATLQGRLDALVSKNLDLAFDLDDLEDGLPQAEADLEGLTTRKDNLEQAAKQARTERDAFFMSEDECTLSEDLHAAQAEARERAAAAKANQAARKAEVTLLREGIDQVNAARAAYKDAQMKLFAAQIEREHQESEAALWRLPIQNRAKRIDAARAALPAARLAEEQANQAFEAAQRALQEAEALEAPRVLTIQDATEAMLEADRVAAEAERQLALTDHRVAEQEARIVGWSEDIQRQQLEARMEAAAQQEPALKSAWQERDAAADVAAEMAEVLVETEIYLEELQEEIMATQAELAEGFSAAHMEILQELLQELPAARAAINEARKDAADAATVATQARKDFDELLRNRAHRDEALQSLLDDYDAVKKDLGQAHQQDADASNRREQAEFGLAEASRREAVHALQTEAQAFILDQHELIAKFHNLKDDSDVHSEGVILDLIDEGDRKKARRIDGWEDLKDFRQKLDAYALQMLQKGATIDELSAMMEAVPNGLRPNAWRAEVNAFSQLQTALELTPEQREEAAVLKAARKAASPDSIKEGIRDKLKRIKDSRFTEQLGATEKVDLITGKVEKVLDNPLYTEVPEVLEKIEDAIGCLGEGLEFVQASEAAGQVGAAKERYNEVTNRFVDSVLDLKERGVELFEAVKPILDTFKGPVDLLAKDIIEASIRRGQARHSRLLAQAAKVAGSPLANAFEEAVARENELWAKYAVSATMDTLDIVGKIAMLYPDQTAAAVGAAIQIGAATIRNNVDMAAAVTVDWSTAKKAKALLARAKKGDAKAKTELTRYHPLYAKGLIAHMAREGDPFATLYVTSRGIDESSIQKNSARILAHYLLDDAEQLDEEGNLILETRREWWERKKKDWTGKIVAGLKLIKDALLNWRKSDAQGAREKMMATRRAAKEMANAVLSARRVLERLKDRRKNNPPTDKDALQLLDRQIKEVANLVETYNQTFSQARQDAVLGLEVLSRVEREVAIMADRVDRGGLKDDAIKAFHDYNPVLPKLREGYLAVVEHVAQAA